jgi:hypothetical protein
VSARESSRGRAALAPLVALGLGFVALIGGSLVGWNAGLLDALVTPPPLIRAALVGGSVAVGIVLLGRSLGRLAEAGRDDVPGLVRAVRLAFLAVAAFAAAAGWALAHPLPLIVAAVIAGIDVIETSFLLLVVGAAPERDDGS